ncbi:MAG: hypothetical protein Q8R37_04625 [Nanoarchaeota archaeon]|nr:hypothetical protein [Nanoarchaeota archaeon]
MEIKDINANQGNIDLVAEIVTKEDARSFEKFGKTGRVCNAMIKDGSGQIKLTLWNDDIDKVNVNDKIHLQNGWCSEFRGEKQLSAGKFGKIEIVGTAAVSPSASTVVAAASLTGGKPTVQKDDGDDDADDSSDDDAEYLPDEEFID